MIKTWQNGAKGGEVRDIIEYNFNLLSKYLSKDIRALSTQERNLLSSDYLNENTLVFDTDEEQWYKYSKGTWVETSISNSTSIGGNTYVQNISINDWRNNKIQIDVNQHGIQNPIAQLFVGYENSFIPVLGGVEIDSKYNVTLSTDLPFDGKVVIK